jgi:hypothetical protein
MKALRMAVALAGAVALHACAASQQRADEAITAAEEAMTAQHAEAIRFAPEAFDAVMQSYGAARDAYERKDWAAAAEAAEQATAAARQFPAAIAAGKATAQEQWPAERDSVAAMLAALGGRLDEVLRTRRYPEGRTADDVRAMRARVDSLSAMLGTAGAEFDKGDLGGAVHASDRIRMEAGRLMGELGLMPRNPHGM